MFVSSTARNTARLALWCLLALMAGPQGAGAGDAPQPGAPEQAAAGEPARKPEIVEPLRDGRLCLVTVAEVARVLTPENRHDVLPNFFHLSKREAQALAATSRPTRLRR